MPATPGEDAERGLRSYTAVPDYAVASRGFLGGVPPLSSMTGLPSYDEAEREHGHGQHSAGGTARSSSEAVAAAQE